MTETSVRVFSREHSAFYTLCVMVADGVIRLLSDNLLVLPCFIVCLCTLFCTMYLPPQYQKARRIVSQKPLGYFSPKVIEGS